MLSTVIESAYLQRSLKALLTLYQNKSYLFMTNLFFSFQFFYFILLLYFYCFYRSNAFKEDFFFFDFFSYKFLFVNIKRLNHEKYKRLHVILCLFLCCLSLFFLFYICFEDFSYINYNPVEHFKLSFGSVKDEDIFKHLEIKKKLINELCLSNNHLQSLLESKGYPIPNDLNEKIKTLIDRNHSVESMLRSSTKSN